MMVNYSLNCLVSTFKSSCTLVMVWKPFLGFDKCSLVFMPHDTRTNINFVNVVYKGFYRKFNFMLNDLDTFLLMKDGATLLKEHQ